jgi:hypothetical protein
LKVNNCFAVYPFGFWGNDLRHWAFTEKLKVLGRYRKEREKNLKKNFPGERVS